MPKFCIAVSGGADSTALALLTQHWVAVNGGSLLALIVDHGLRAGAEREAALTRSRLAARGISARVLTLSGLPAGAKLQETARLARANALAAAARAAGAVFLLLGHHAADQDETVAMRAVRGEYGLEGMAGWAAREDVVLLRPLLGMRPETLRHCLADQGVEWVEDPSNTDLRFERVRVRQAGTAQTAASPAARRESEQTAAVFLARHCTLRAEGFAVVREGAMPPAALAGLLRMVAGSLYAPNRAAVASLAVRLRPASLGGVVIRRTARCGGGWLLAREPAACAPAVAAVAGAVWDGRYRLAATARGADFGPLGADAARFRQDRTLPALVLRGLPCLRHGDKVAFPAPVRFTPPMPAAGHVFSA